MYVVGAIKAEFLKEVRQIVPNHFLLVPGVGAQGGSLEEVEFNVFVCQSITHQHRLLH